MPCTANSAGQSSDHPPDQIRDSRCEIHPPARATLTPLHSNSIILESGDLRRENPRAPHHVMFLSGHVSNQIFSIANRRQGPDQNPGSMVMEITGGCFCARVRYRIDAPLGSGRSCHCSRCRKAFSGSGSAYSEVSPGSFFWVSGEENLIEYESTPGWGLCFCSACGTTLCGIHNGQVHGVTLGSVDGDPGVEIEMHLFVGSKAPWDHIGGDVPQFDEHAIIVEE
jgi:hypothetical protein